MKHVRALFAEPVLLAKYRSDHPSEDQRPADEATATWEGFKTAQAAYKQVLDELVKAQQGLCLYCEQSLVDASSKLIPNDYQVEHVRPKSGAAGRVLDWRNLALACAGGTCRDHQDPTRKHTFADDISCGQRKDDRDLPQGCDPRTAPLLDPLVEVGLDGRISCNTQSCMKAGVSRKDVEDAIALLNVNCERLRKARQDTGNHVRSFFVAILELLEEHSPHLTDAQWKQQVDLLVAGQLQPSPAGALHRFWSAERHALGLAAEAWLASNQDQFVGPSSEVLEPLMESRD